MPQQQDWFAQQGEPPADDWFAAQDQQQPPTTKAPKSVAGFLSNIPGSAMKAVEGTVNMVMNPIQSLKAAAAEKQAQESEAVAHAFGGGPSPYHSKSIVGELGRIGEESYQDPVGVGLAFATNKPTRIPTSPVKGALVRGATRTMRGAIKPNTGDLNKMSGATQAGLDAMSEKVAQTALKEGFNPLRGKGLEGIQRRVDALDAERNAKIAKAPQDPVPGSGTRQLQSLRPIERKYGPKSQTFSEADVADVRKLRGELRRNPALTRQDPSPGVDWTGTEIPGPNRMKDLTPDELNLMNKGDNKALSGKFGKVGDAEIDARKAVIGSRRDILDEVVPGIKAQGQRLRDLIDLRNVANVARKRGEGRDLFGLTDLISLAAGRPEVLLATTLMRPAAQAGLARAIYGGSKLIPESVNLTPAMRAALLAELLEDRTD